MKKAINKGLSKILAAGTAAGFVGAANAGGVSQVNTLMTSVQDVLTGVALVTVTCAILWAGYKILFGGQTFREVSPIVIGGILVGAAAQIAAMFISY
ncbi:TPA: TrbC/VirB2 family protein [Yersinia enterocolitica]|nr:TrbC/VirB2 family protein [Yersinia enterocolitica]